MLQNVCVFSGSSDQIDGVYLDAARETGRCIAERGLTLIYGAGSTGMMGALADSALEANADVIGIIPRRFYTPQLVHTGLTDLRIVETMHQRKAAMVDLAEAFCALPGGFGTLEELFEVLTWAQVGIHSKPVGILNVGGYFDPLMTFVEHIRAHGFIYDEHRALLLRADNPDDLLDKLAGYQPPKGLERWVERKETQS
jgi:hypothetical protein